MRLSLDTHFDIEVPDTAAELTDEQTDSLNDLANHMSGRLAAVAERMTKDPTHIVVMPTVSKYEPPHTVTIPEYEPLTVGPPPRERTLYGKFYGYDTYVKPKRNYWKLWGTLTWVLIITGACLLVLAQIVLS